MHQYTSARERQRETEWEKREREGREGCARPSLIHPPPPLPHQGGGLSQLPILPASWSPLCSIFSCCQPLWAWPWHTTLALKVTSLCLWVHSAWFLHFNSCYHECIWMAFIPAIRSLNIKNIKRSLVELRWILEAVLQRLLLWFSHVGCCFFSSFNWQQCKQC